MGRKSARKGIGNKFSSADAYTKLKRKNKSNNEPWHKAKNKNQSKEITVDKLDDSR